MSFFVLTWKYCSCFLTLILICGAASDPYDCQFYIEYNDDLLYFDLARLSKNVSWSFPVNEGGIEGNTVHFSICGHPEKHLCKDKDAVACITDNNISNVHLSAGRFSTRKATYDDNQLTLEFSDGAQCPNGQEKYSTTFFLSCSDNDEDQPNKIVQNECRLLIGWESNAACPVKTPVIEEEYYTLGNNCIFTLMGSRFNLSKLHVADHYKVVGKNGKRYEMNICGTVSNSNCNGKETTVCEIEHDKPVIRAVQKMEMALNADSSLLLLYKTAEDKRGVEIILECSRKSENNNLEFVREENNKLFFKMKTYMACLDESVLCSISGGGEDYYSLISLNKRSGSWKIDVPKENITYYFNVCGLLHNDSDVPCAFDGSARACLWDKKSKSGHILGTKQLQPSIKKLNIVFINGNECENSTDEHQQYSLDIEMKCDSEIHPPEYVSRSKCRHKLLWKTPSACTIQENTGHNCEVKEPTHGHIFDFKSLRMKSRDYEINISEIDESVVLNICGPIVGSCETHKTDTVNTNAGICWKNGGKMKMIGEPLLNPIYKNGVVRFEVSSVHSCRVKGPLTKVIITMICDYNKTDKEQSGPTFESKDMDSCLFRMAWHTVKACKPSTNYNCSVEDNEGNIYNLSSLTLYNNNYVVPFNLPDKTGQFIINICRSVTVGKGFIFGENEGAYMVNFSEQKPAKRFLPIGSVKTSMLYFENGILKLCYKSGAVCNHGENGDSATVIEFYCINSNEETEPMFLNETDCIYTFSWKTRAACPVKIEANMPHNPSDSSVSDENKLDAIHVDITDHSNQFTKDFLKKLENTLSTTSKLEENKNSDVIGTRSTDESSSVLANMPINDEAKLNPIDDVETQIPPQPESTFVAEPYLDTVSCTAVNPSTNYRFDLSSLTRDVRKIEDDDKRVINIAVCRALKGFDMAGSSVNGLSGGIANNKLEYHNGSLILKYVNGDRCINNKVMKNVDDEESKTDRKVTLIEFLCSSQKRKPSLSKSVNDSEDCQINIVWPTELACERKISCSALDTKRQRNIHLEVLMGFFSNYRIKVGASVFLINICQPLVAEKNISLPSNSSSYLVNLKKNLGKVLVAPKLTRDDVIVLNYAEGSQCLTNTSLNYTSSIHFICDIHVGKGAPTFYSYSSESCKYTFQWMTSVVCPEKEKSVFVDNCMIRDNKHNTHLNLSRFTVNKITNEASQLEYKMQFCENVVTDFSHTIMSKRSDTNWLSYDYTQVTLDYTQNITTLHYLSDRSCGIDDKFSLVLLLKCSKHAGRGIPNIKMEGDCMVAIEWISVSACYESNNTDSEDRSSTHHENLVIRTWVLIAVIIIGCLTTFFSKNARRKLFCRQNRRKVHARYNKVCSEAENLQFEEVTNESEM